MQSFLKMYRQNSQSLQSEGKRSNRSVHLMLHLPAVRNLSNQMSFRSSLNVA